MPSFNVASAEFPNARMSVRGCGCTYPLAASAKTLHYLGLPRGTTKDQYSAVTEANKKLKPDVAKGH